MARNLYRVSKKQWQKWTAQARHVFNAVYAFMLDNPQIVGFPEKPMISPRQRKIIAWNSAWIAADASDDNIQYEYA